MLSISIRKTSSIRLSVSVLGNFLETSWKRLVDTCMLGTCCLVCVLFTLSVSEHVCFTLYYPILPGPGQDCNHHPGTRTIATVLPGICASQPFNTIGNVGERGEEESAAEQQPARLASKTREDAHSGGGQTNVNSGCFDVQYRLYL